jgi:hypothetical protein
VLHGVAPTVTERLCPQRPGDGRLAVRPPHVEQRRRNVAGVRRAAAKPLVSPMIWRGVAGRPHPASDLKFLRCTQHRYQVRRRVRKLTSGARLLVIFALPGVDNTCRRPLYTAPTTRRRLGAKARLRSSSLIGWPSSRFRSDARSFDGSPAYRRRGLKYPSCLTGESEERETWTAESLRAASSIGEGLPSSKEDAAGRDFGGTRFRSTMLVANREIEVRSV